MLKNIFPKDTNMVLGTSNFVKKGDIMGSILVVVGKSCPTLCDPINCSTPGFPVLQYLLELAQTQVH